MGPLVARGALLLAALGCSARPEAPAAQVEAPAAEAAFERACPDLPPNRPGDLAITFSQYDYERPEDRARWALHGPAAPCPPDETPLHMRDLYRERMCVPASDSAMDALYASLLACGLDRVRTRPSPPWPHQGGTGLKLAWGARSCEVEDVINRTEVAPEDRETYGRCRDLVIDAIRAAAQ